MKVTSFAKNKFEEVKVEISEYQGKNYINLRVFCDAEGKEERVPTKKGLTLSVSLFPELKEAIEKLGMFLQKKELI